MNADLCNCRKGTTNYHPHITQINNFVLNSLSPMDVQSTENLGTRVFKDVKPYCVKLSQLTFSPNLAKTINNPGTSKQICDALKDLNKHLNDSISQHVNNDYSEKNLPTALADYVFVPITELLKLPSLGDTELEYTLSIINTLISYCWSSIGSLPKQMALQFFPLLTFLIGGSPNDSKMKQHSDETLSNGVHCIQSLLKGCQNQGGSFCKSIFEDTKMMPCLGHLISVLLDVVLSCSSTDVQITALDTLKLLYQLLNDGEILSFVLPGTISSMSKLMIKNPHYQVTIKALEVIRVIVSCCFNDVDLDVHKKHVQTIEDLKDSFAPVDDDESTENDFKVFIPENVGKRHRTTAWLRATSYQLQKGFKVILNIKEEKLSRHAVRQALFDLIISIFANCFKSCEVMLPTLFNTLTDVCCSDVMFHDILIASMKASVNFADFKLLLDDSLVKDLDKLSFVLSSPDTTKILSLFNRLTFFTTTMCNLDFMDEVSTERLINTLNDELAFLLQLANSSNAKKKITAGSLTSIVTDKKKSYSTEMKLISSNYLGTGLDFEEPVLVSIFDGIFDKDVEAALLQLLKSLSNSPTICHVLDQLSLNGETMNNQINNTIQQSTSIWLSTTILSFKDVTRPKTVDPVDEFMQFDDSDNDDSESIRTVTDDADELTVVLQNNVYASLEKSYEVLDLVSTESKGSLGSIKATIMALSTIGNACVILGDSFQDELVDYLYPVIDNLASSNDLVRGEAQSVAMTIANQLYDGSVQKLIFENADYLVDALSNRLTGDTLTPRTPIVLNVLIRIGGIEILNQLKDLIVTIFTLLDLYHAYSSLTEGFFSVFNEIIDQVYKHYFRDFDFEKLEKDLEEDDVNYAYPWGATCLEDAFEFVSRKFEVPEDILENDEDGDSDDEDIPDEVLKRNKFLNIDSDDEDQSDRSELESIDTNFDPDKQHPTIEPDEDDGDKWTSPIDTGMYSTLLKMFTYAERLCKSSSSTVSIAALTLIDKLVPILATQKSKLLPIIAQTWQIIVSFLLESEDFRIIEMSLKVLGKFIKFGNTFLTSRVINLYGPIQKNVIFRRLVDRQMSIYKSKKAGTKGKKIVNQTSTSVNWDIKLYNSLSEFLIFTLVKFGRFIPTSSATIAINMTLPFTDSPKAYGFHEDLAIFLQDNYFDEDNDNSL
ncbi:unnamed protein product [Ambrosiozyma monospora]|uniref:Unnamed protein product n=1 Tax=Ambrosiozyma monospora TaxID=43982 RepID=A0A9W7DD47_AMBMO|nr:unnamed protein product [Ambrosiozyma monospora]